MSMSMDFCGGREVVVVQVMVLNEAALEF